MYKDIKKINLSAGKLNIIQRICELQDKDLIDLIKNIITVPDVSKSEWWRNISQEEIASINRGFDDLQKGKVQSHDQIRRKYETWLKEQVDRRQHLFKMKI